MMHLWCWLFSSCVAATPAPAPHVPVPVAPPSAVALPGPPETLRLTLSRTPPLVPPAPPMPPAWQRFGVAAPAAEGRPVLVVVFDDMGGAPVLAARAIELPGPLTLAWAPDAPQLAAQVAAGTAHGHEAMLHMPAEPLGRAEPAAGALRTWAAPAANLAVLRAALGLVPNAVGLVPGEGGPAELSVPLMDLVMGELRGRRMAFLDCPALPHAVAPARAAAAGVALAVRDLVIDADPNPLAIRARLADAESIAQAKGHAILIAHARPATLDVLEPYLPALAGRGFVLWPLSAVFAAASSAVRTAAGQAAIAPPRSSGAE